MSISDFIERSNAAVSTEALFALLVDAAGAEGFGQVAYGTLNYRASEGGPPAPAVALNYPVEWCKRYFEQGYHRIDPVVTHTPAIAHPFLWEDLGRRFALERKQTLLLNEAREIGLRNGAGVPLHGPWGRVAVVSFASDSDHAGASAKLGHLNALATQYHVAVSHLTPSAQAQRVDLSQRERDCLAWTAQGKSSWDIGMILAISENTVNFHIKNAMRKLETTSRTVAVVKAIRLGLIDIPTRL